MRGGRERKWMINLPKFTGMSCWYLVTRLEPQYSYWKTSFFPDSMLNFGGVTGGHQHLTTIGREHPTQAVVWIDFGSSNLLGDFPVLKLMTLGDKSLVVDLIMDGSILHDGWVSFRSFMIYGSITLISNSFIFFLQTPWMSRCLKRCTGFGRYGGGSMILRYGQAVKKKGWTLR